jgi:polyisoprenoid-binding protein YceI
MRRHLALVVLAVAGGALLPHAVVGHTADTGIQGELSVDPAKPQTAKGMVKVDMNTVRTGIDKRDADMRSQSYLETDNPANQWVTFDVQSVEIAGPLESGKVTPAKIRGLLTVKQKPVERVVDGTVTYTSCRPTRSRPRSGSGSPRTTSRCARSWPRPSPITACKSPSS